MVKRLVGAIILGKFFSEKCKWHNLCTSKRVDKRERKCLDMYKACQMSIESNAYGFCYTR